MLFELVSQQHAFEGQSLMGVMYKIVEGNLPEWPNKYSKDLHKVFTRYNFIIMYMFSYRINTVFICDMT